MSTRVRSVIRVEGVVQGVGFRPFVYGLAVRLGLGGLVGNDERGVFIEVEGAPALVAEFTAALRTSPPPLATVERVSARAVPVTGETRFAIARSTEGGTRRALVSPDVATCDDCLREMDDPADRRYGYAFVNCTNCGPRFTIVRDVPYDRPNTTMAGFAMCADCAREYHDPADRRFHAQPVCCPACGPRLRLLGRDGEPLAGDPVEEAVRLLRDGGVLAVKGLGGYHLAALASRESAVAALRARKHRQEKPFAVMVADLAGARSLCEVDEVEERLLTSGARPIVLLRGHEEAASLVAPSVAPAVASPASLTTSATASQGTASSGTSQMASSETSPLAASTGVSGETSAEASGESEGLWLGVMLPYTPLHHLLLRRLGEPVVLTSGNVSDEPIAYRDEDALTRLRGVADAFLVHDRPIHTRTDDSVLRVLRGRELPLRRSRGYAPRPLPLPLDLSRPVLACGAELKHTFCVARGTHAFVSHHIGDLENYETFRSFTEGVEHFLRLFDVVPEVVAHDLHPEYMSTKYALALEGAHLVGVQHHHAHIASCLADNGVTGPVIGVAFDGLGYGPDATLWGGEFLVADLVSFERAGHLATVPMPGGAAAVRQPWRMAAACLDMAYGGAVPDDLDVVRRNAESWDGVLALGRRGVNAPLTSSAGRLFDAVASVAGVRDVIGYEGQAAIEWERLADPVEKGHYGHRLTGSSPFVVHGADLVAAVAEDVRAGTETGTVSARFHNTVARIVAEGCARVRETSGLSTVALSGGVFQNALLLVRAAALLEEDGFQVLTHGQVPPNDGGISLGQAAVAGARDNHR
ncbi:carbamoyltransferase HypF [Streptosporangium saharense]|uniref:carbamoyltransferase HypF n=1 Tax=Streptosporangium saharense TaxID=1706840 RepID=UPI00368B828B